MASHNPTDLLLESADTLQSVPPPQALNKLRSAFFHNESIPVDLKFKALKVKDFLSLTFIHYICMACKDSDVASFVGLFDLCFEIADKYAAEHDKENPVKTRLQLNLMSSTGQNVLHLLAQQRKPHLIDALLQLLLERDKTHLIKPLAADKIGRTFMDLLLHWGKGDEALAIVTKYEHHFGFAEAKKTLGQKLYLLKEKESSIKQKSKEEAKVPPHVEPPLARLESLSATPIDQVSLDVKNDPIKEIRRQIYEEGQINPLLIQNIPSLSKDSQKHLILQHLNMTLLMELVNLAPGAFIKQARSLIQALQKYFTKHFSVQEFKAYIDASPSYRGYPFYLEAVRLHSYDLIQACLALEDIVQYDWTLLDKRQNTVFHLILTNSKLNNRERLSLIQIFLEKVYSLVTSINVEGFTPYGLALKNWGQRNDNFGDKILTMMEGLENFSLYKEDINLRNTAIIAYHRGKIKVRQLKALMNPLQICIRRGLLDTFKRLVAQKGLPLQWLCMNGLTLLQIAVEYDQPVQFLYFILDNSKLEAVYYYQEQGEEQNSIHKYMDKKRMLEWWVNLTIITASHMSKKAYLEEIQERNEELISQICDTASVCPIYARLKQGNILRENRMK